MKEWLDEKSARYNRAEFVAIDPISLPHRFSGKEDREIAAFLSATISWGTRKSIIKNGLRLVEWMDCSPAAFIRGFSEGDLDPFRGFVHRTFNGADLVTFLYALKNIYERHGGMEEVFRRGVARAGGSQVPAGKSPADAMAVGHRVKMAIMHFREVFFELPHPVRTRKHVSDPGSGSAAKRLNMMLRWLVRRDDAGVDLGIWDALSPADLVCPLDVHSGRVARKLGLLNRKQNDWKAAVMLTERLRQMDPSDPVKYDFALFGMGVFEGME